MYDFFILFSGFNFKLAARQKAILLSSISKIIHENEIDVCIRYILCYLIFSKEFPYIELLSLIGGYCSSSDMNLRESSINSIFVLLNNLDEYVNYFLF